MADVNCIQKLMMEYVYREVITDTRMQTDVADKFFLAKTKTEVINLLGYALGYVRPEVTDLREFERDELFEPSLRKQLLPIVERMPSFEFLLLPLVLIQDGKGISQMPLLRVRKPPTSDQGTDTDVYLDMSLRVYASFATFLERNRLPPCQLWYPTDGLIRFDAHGKLRLSRTTIAKRNDGVWKALAVAGNVAATGLMLTPIAPVAAPILLLVSNVPLIGFSIADLVDGCRYERGSVIASRSAALVVNLVTFSAVGFTAAARATKLTNLLSPAKLRLLQEAKLFMDATTKTVSFAQVVFSIIGTVGGWQQLTGGEWVQVATSLCFTFRKVICVEMAVALFRYLQEQGVVEFFSSICTNVAPAVLRSRVGPWLGHLLEMVFNFLSSSVEFTVDDEFTTIRLFGYELKFETLFQLHVDRMRDLLVYLRDFVAPVRTLCMTAGQPELFTTDALFAVIDLLKLVSQLPDVSCELKECITIGKGHQLSFNSLRAWWGAPAHDRVELARAIVSLDASKTEQLNVIRQSRLGPDGDAALFGWLVRTGNNDQHNHKRALHCLLAIAEGTQSRANTDDGTIAFDGPYVVISPLLRLSPDEYVTLSQVRLFLSDTRFMQFCKGAQEEHQRGASKPPLELLSRARRVWLRTCHSGYVARQLELVPLLEKLFARANTTAPPLTLANALDCALQHEEGSVQTVYYSILVAWRTMVEQKRATFDADSHVARFQQLMIDARKLEMNRYMELNENINTEAQGDDWLIQVARQATRFIRYGEQCKQPQLPLFFGSTERAACWLHLLPALRHKEGREQFNSTVRWLLKSGDAKVLLDEPDGDADELKDHLTERDGSTRRVMFYHGRMMIILEMLSPGYCSSTWHASFQLCNLSLKIRSSRACLEQGENAATTGHTREE